MLTPGSEISHLCPRLAALMPALQHRYVRCPRHESKPTAKAGPSAAAPDAAKGQPPHDGDQGTSGEASLQVRPLMPDLARVVTCWLGSDIKALAVNGLHQSYNNLTNIITLNPSLTNQELAKIKTSIP